MSETSLLLDYLDAAQEAARRGAEVIESWRSRFSVTEKSRADLVTDADHASQRAIFKYLLERYPDHDFLGEEDAEAAAKTGLPPDAPPTWIVDPVDGTANYVHDIPFYCVSIGLMIDGDLRVGIVYDPRAKEMFAAAQGHGATLNGVPIHVSTIPTLRDAMISTGFPANAEKQLRNLEMWKIFSYEAQGIRRTGSTALNMAYVAAGRFDAYWAYDNYCWDVAGGIVLIREAGGHVTCADGAVCDPFRHDILATNQLLHAEMQSMLNQGPKFQ